MPHWSQLFDEIEADIADASVDMASTIQADVVDRISKPVGYEVGPHGGTIVIRSKPGEPPRTETHLLMEGVKSEVIHVDGQISASIYDEVSYAADLEGRLNRPIMTDLAETYTDFVADGVARAAAGNL